MAEESPAPSFQQLAEHGRAVLDGLQALESVIAIQLADQHASLTRSLKELEAVARERDELREAEGGWLRDRERLQREHQAIRAAHDELAQTHSRCRLELDQRAEELAQLSRTREGERAQQQQEIAAIKGEMERTAARSAELEKRVADLRTAQMQWAAERQRLIQEHARQLEESQRAVKGDYDALVAQHSELIAESSTLAEELSAIRQSQSGDVTRLTKDLEQARELLSRSVAEASARETALEEQRHQLVDERNKLEAELLEARRAASGLTLSEDDLHRMTTHINTLIGFTQILGDERKSTLTPEERKEFLGHLHSSAQSLAEAVTRAGAAMAAPPQGGEESVAPVAPATAPGWDMPVILVADAEPATRERIEPLLRRASYEVVFAGTADEALQRAVSMEPIAMLIDTQLPPSGALPLIDKLKRDPRTRDLPVVLACRNDREPPALGLTHLDTLIKPIDRQRLLQVMVKNDVLAEGNRAKKMPSSLLVVDDDTVTTQLITALLKPYDMKVAVAESGPIALELLGRHRFDLVILDLRLPDMDGFQVLEAIRQSPNTARTPVVVYTAHRLRGEERARLQGKVQAVVPKGDFNRDRFIELVHKRGERRRRSGGTRADRPAA